MPRFEDQCDHSRGLRSLLSRGCVLVAVCLLSFQSGLRADSPPKSTAARPLTDLVQRLRAPSFQARLQAEADCRESGSSVLPALTESLKSSDPELRRRAQLLIERIEEDELVSSIDAFLEPGSTTTLPGWAFVVELIDDRHEFRTAYAEVLRGDPQLVRALAHPHLIGAELQRQLQALMPTRGPISPRAPVDSTAILLLLVHPEATYPSALGLAASRQISFRLDRRINETPAEQLLRALVTRWVITAHAGPAAERLVVGVNLSLPESLVPALEMIKQKADARQQHQMGFAFVAIARYGDAKEMAAVEALLDDHFELTSSQDGDGKVVTSTQLGDLALATLIAMTKQEPTQYGLLPFQRDSENTLTSLSSVSFKSEEARQAAFEKWHAWSEENMRKFQAMPAQAEEGIRL